MARAQGYLWLNDKYLKEAKTLMEEGDYVQAAEKFWGAAAEIVKAVAVERGVEIRSHGEWHGFATKLGKELNDPALPSLFGTAAALHQNFYEKWLPPETVVAYSGAVRQLVERLNKLLDRHDH
ncbi:MAG: PaREP1 family protein [Anaerolineae bacterium]